MKIANIALTHAGKFHADDVFSSAFLRIINPKIRIVRVTEVPEGFEGLVFDIGRGKFDHHQTGAEVRANGVPYAAFGLLWREYGRAFLEESGCPREDSAAEASHFDDHFVQPLDATDNTGCRCQLAEAVGAFNPVWDSDAKPDDCFEEAVSVGEKILRRQFAGILAEQRGRSLVREALSGEKDRVVVLPRFAPWKSVLVPSDALFVVYPSKRGGFSAQAVTKALGSEEMKCPFPDAWAGKENAELQKVSGIRSLRFCHKGRFLISADRKEDALKACRAAAESMGKHPA